MVLTSASAVAAVFAIPLTILFFWVANQICLCTLVTVLVFCLLLFVGIPLIFWYSYSLQCHILFLNVVNLPNVNFNKPASLGLLGARNLQLTTPDKVKLGVWHMIPVKHQLEAVAHNWLLSGENNRLYDQWMSSEVTVVYCHGNAGNRATDHRIQLYKLFNELNYHVIALDYRGYADSTSAATDEQGVVNDVKTVIDWVQERVGTGHIFVWGHSLGTGIASHALAELEAEGKRVAGLFLEAPFTNLGSEIREYPIAQLFKHLPWFDFCFIDSMYDNKLRFESDKNLLNVSTPIQFLHAEDDRVVPYKLGRKLYEIVLSHRKDHSSVQFATFESKLGLGHKFICKDKRTPSIVRTFVEQNLKKTST